MERSTFLVIIIVTILSLACGGGGGGSSGTVSLSGTIDFTGLSKPNVRQAAGSIVGYDLVSLSGIVLQTYDGTSSSYSFTEVVINTAYVVRARLSSGGNVEALTEAVTQNTIQEVSLETTVTLMAIKKTYGENLNQITDLESRRSQTQLLVVSGQNDVVKAMEAIIKRNIESGTVVTISEHLGNDDLKAEDNTLDDMTLASLEDSIEEVYVPESNGTSDLSVVESNGTMEISGRIDSNLSLVNTGEIARFKEGLVVGANLNLTSDQIAFEGNVSFQKELRIQ
jgi:hypothetical protein